MINIGELKKKGMFQKATLKLQNHMISHKRPLRSSVNNWTAFHSFTDDPQKLTDLSKATALQGQK